MHRTLDVPDALEELRQMVASDVHPVLEETVLMRLLAGSQVKDAAGLFPTDADWVATWDLDAAAAEGWRRKAGRVAGDYSFTDSESTLNRSHVIQHCLKMAAEYAKKISPTTKMYAFVDETAAQDAYEEEIRSGYAVFEGAWFVP